MHWGTDGQAHGNFQERFRDLDKTSNNLISPHTTEGNRTPLFLNHFLTRFPSKETYPEKRLNDI